MFAIRLENLVIKNIRNLKEVKISMEEYEDLRENNSKEYSNILGLFGPNGSGKTSILYAIDILKTVMSGKNFTTKHINNKNKGASISATFYISDYKKFNYLVDYSFIFTRNSVVDELLKITKLGGKTIEVPKFGNSNLKSQIFNEYNMQNYGLIKELMDFANNKLVLSFNKNIVEFDIKDFYSNMDSKIFNLLQPLYIEADEINLVNQVLDKINNVLSLVVKRELNLVNYIDNRYMAVVKTDNGYIDLAEESLGIINIIQLVINLIPLSVDSSRCLCVDEIESSVFDSLTTEIIKSVDSCLSGQIIFTSHQFSLLDELKNTNIYYLKDGVAIKNQNKCDPYHSYLNYIYRKSDILPSRAHVSVAFRKSGGN